MLISGNVYQNGSREPLTQPSACTVLYCAVWRTQQLKTTTSIDNILTLDQNVGKLKLANIIIRKTFYKYVQFKV